MYTFVYRTFIKFILFCRGQALDVALSVPCSRNTVAKVLKMAQELKLCWPLQDNQTDEVLEKLFYPQLNNRKRSIVDA